ncbi:uncharacterized protein ppp1r18 isoform X2 [Myripristis murdjan]|uniref:uncharacterized protein ppp1r18 isoform X2 n=1 Tax=Myripristis murdjan TaxID=586833 RepID=UPI0011762201|nr:uncharacterized protein LOC115367420 isoform X2 [Myripristis murdjan]
MSVSSLPEWKQLLLEKKRREEEERERREKEEEEKLASMPAWKRGIIERRRAKQEGLGDKDREKEREGFLVPVEARSPSDGLSDTDSSVTVNLGSEPSLSPDPGQWLDAETKPLSQVSVETIVPVHENPFIRTQSGWRKGRDAEKAAEGNEQEAEVVQTTESGRGTDIELKIERFRDRNEGREGERKKDKSEGKEKEGNTDRSEGRDRETNRDRDTERSREPVKNAVKEQGGEIKQEEKREEKDTDTPCSLFAPLVSGLRTIRADNIIIIEQDRKGSDERRGKWRETEREMPEEDQPEKRGMKMDLSEILAGGGSVTEIRASEVLIIKPSLSPEERSAGGGGGKWSGRDNGEKERAVVCTVDALKDSMGREHRPDTAWLREKERETVKEKERPWGHATVIKEDRKDSSDDNAFVERGGRVSQLLSKFGEHPKPPSRSKSSDNFHRPAVRKYSEGQDEQQSEERKADEKNALLRGVPKRSFSFSERVFSAKENGVAEEALQKRRAFAVQVDGSEKDPMAKIKLGRAWVLDKDLSGKHKDEHVKNEVHTEREPGPKSHPRTETEICTSAQHRAEVSSEKGERGDKRAVEMAGDADGDEGFTVASVKNTEGISFARRVPIRQDGRAKATEREVKRLTEDSRRASLEKGWSLEKGREGVRQAEPQGGEKRGSHFRKGEGTDGTVPGETVQQSYIITASVDPTNPSHSAETQNRHAAAFMECSNLLCAVADRQGEAHRGAEWSGTGPQGPYLTQSASSQHTEQPINKIEKVGETTVYCSDRGEKAYRGAYELNKDAHDAQMYNDIRSESLTHDVIPKFPKRIAPMGAPTGPLEIQIPRTVFYVAEDMMVERKRPGSQSDEGQECEAGRGIERRDSWRIGKPLSRVESLREKIRQKELERMRRKQRGAEEEGVSDGTEVPQRVGDRCEEGGSDMEREWEAASQMRKRLAEADGGQEGPAAQTSMNAFDVTQEVSVLKTSPQLPVSLPFSQAVRGEEVASEYTAAVSEVTSESPQISEDEDDLLKHVVEQLRRHRALQREDGSRGEGREEEEEELSEHKEQTSPPSPSQSLSPSPPHPNSLAAMSRIYNLKTVGSRTGLCVRERTVDIPSVRLVKVKPHISHTQQESYQQETADVRQLWGGGKLGDSKAKSDEDLSGVQSIQRQIEHFQLREQEALKSSHDGCTPRNAPQTDKEIKGQQSPRGRALQQVKDDLRTQQKDQQTSALSPRSSESSQRDTSSTSELKHTQSRVVTITPKSLRSQSPDYFLKLPDCAPTPASSPCSPSPAQSPSVSPSPTPSPTLFSIRSASGGQVKRGATITVTPKRPAGGGAAVVSPPVVPSAAKAPAKQTPSPAAVAEPTKKRYPTVEEIEVIGGYQHLEKSCLVKGKGTPKKGKVSFDEVQLERVCEYPSESSMLACTPYPHELVRDERPQEEDTPDEEEEERGVMVSKSTRNVGTATGRVLRVDESCPR